MPRAPKDIPVPPLTGAMFQAGRKSTKQRATDVVRARYNRRDDALTLVLRNGIAVQMPRSQIREIANAPPSEVAKVEIQPGGDGITFRSLDVDIYAPGLLADKLGSLFAASLGRKTRGRTSAKKAASSRANGQKGGRPKKRALA